ncbi:pyrophosphatase PpaX [Paenibacillus sp. YN15]|uniref:pyrophosphatase PpaX n=1 Tax=Paenibacillus sp. YN15 TaxID=1742774 RepID=UPI000DCF29B4|nr:pyrophosphatase PpaX [Paenibacillus sp. YN15]RAV02761.1 pyrophosphatase PpaX [Paenibacillus sp. YN15]
MLKAVLFDLDGTILNTNELIIASFLHTLEGETPRVYTREDIIRNFGRTLVDQMREYTGLQNVERYIAKYREFNIERHDELIMDFPHVGEVLEKLHRAGLRLGVVTSKIRKTSLMGLERFGLTPYLDAIITVEDVTEPKPHGEGILKAAAILGVKPEETLMVGDSQYDILAAKHAGTRVAGVAWTAKGEDYLSGLGPDYMIRDMRELLEICGVKSGGAD